MRCARAQRAWIEALPTPGALPGWVERHLEECPACTRETEEMQALWAELALLDEPQPAPADLERRLETLLARVQTAGVDGTTTMEEDASMPLSPATRRKPWLLAAAAVGILVVGGLAGRLSAGRSGPGAPAATTGNAAYPQQFLLLVHAIRGAQPLSPEAARARVAEYSEWARQLDREGRLVSAEKLADDAGVWLGSDAPGSREISGFFLIRARDYAEAKAIASNSPHIKYGGVLEIRAIERTPRSPS